MKRHMKMVPDAYTDDSNSKDNDYKKHAAFLAYQQNNQGLTELMADDSTIQANIENERTDEVVDGLKIT